MRYAKLEQGKLKYYTGPQNGHEPPPQGYLPVELTPKPNDYPRYASRFIEQGGKIVRVWERYPDYKKIRELEQELDSDRYKIDKIVEYTHAGLPCPYTEDEILQYHAQREAIRERIRILKACEDE